MNRGQVRLHFPGHVQHVNKHGGCSIDRSALLVGDCLDACFGIKTRRWEDHRAAMDEGVQVTYDTSKCMIERAAAAYSCIFLVIPEQELQNPNNSAQPMLPNPHADIVCIIHNVVMS